MGLIQKTACKHLASLIQNRDKELIEFLHLLSKDLYNRFPDSSLPEKRVIKVMHAILRSFLYNRDWTKVDEESTVARISNFMLKYENK